MWISACAAIPLLWSVLGLADKTEYDFVEDTSTFVAIHRGDDLLIGRNFVPDLGSKVMDFKDYRYKKDPLFIYNLPGYFKEKNGKPE